MQPQVLSLPKNLSNLSSAPPAHQPTRATTGSALARPQIPHALAKISLLSESQLVFNDCGRQPNTRSLNRTIELLEAPV